MSTGDTKIDKVVNLVQRVEYNAKKLKNYYRKRFNSYSALCRMKLIPMAYKMYNHNIKEICKLYYDTISNTNVDRGNIIVVSCFLEHHFIFLTVMKERVKNIQNDQLLKIAHDLILEKQKELLQCLYENIDSPVSLLDVENMMKEGELINAPRGTKETSNPRASH